MGRAGAARHSAPAAAVGVAVAFVMVTFPMGQASAAEVSPVPASGVWTIDGRGNGHGHGLSQYGARGAAIAGLSYDKILAFYYPGTALASAAAVPIRVQISGTSNNLTLKAEPGLTVTGTPGALPIAGLDMWRLVPITGGFQVQYHSTTTGWHVKSTARASKLDVRSSDGSIGVFRGSAVTTYAGVVSSVLSGAGGAMAVNAVGLDQYTRGVVPSEMSSSWQRAALQAQAVAARTYARYYIEHPRSAYYDICDTTSCQVYGGLTAAATAARYWGSPDPIALTANKILTYNRSTIFAEFSASNGGMTSSGNQPYFVTKPDPYDNAASGDPYLAWADTTAAAALASYYGLARATQIQITARQGGGQWGGLVTAGVVNGTWPNGTVATIRVSGAGLASAMGLSYSYFHIRSVAPSGHLESWAKTALHLIALHGWTFDRSNTAASSTVRVSVDATNYNFPANRPRLDVQRVLHTLSANHGFDVTVPVPGGSHTVCAYGVSLNGADRLALGCKTVVVPVNPRGNLESLTATGGGNFQVRGWTFDPDANGGPARLQVNVDSRIYRFPVALSRPDVQRYYGLANAAVGFNASVPVGKGIHRVCAYGINIAGAGVNVPLRCITVTG